MAFISYIITSITLYIIASFTSAKIISMFWRFKDENIDFDVQIVIKNKKFLNKFFMITIYEIVIIITMFILMHCIIHQSLDYSLIALAFLIMNFVIAVKMQTRNFISYVSNNPQYFHSKISKSKPFLLLNYLLYVMASSVFVLIVCKLFKNLLF